MGVEGAIADLGGTPEMLETTTLTDRMQTYIPGIQSLDALEFTSNYTLDEYKKLKALDGIENDYAVWFGGTESPPCDRLLRLPRLEQVS